MITGDISANDDKKSRTIVHSTAALNNYPLRNIDTPTVVLLKNCIPAKSRKSDLRNPLLGLLNCYLDITGQKLTFLSLSRKSTHKLLSGFIGALLSNTFVNAAQISRDMYVRAFLRALKILSAKVPDFESDFDFDIASNHWEKSLIDPLQCEYYLGWPIKSKTGKTGGHLKMAWVWHAIGPELVRAIHTAANNFVERYEARSSNNFIPVLNEFFEYLEKTHPKISTIQLNDPSFTTKLIESFCRQFFERNVNTNNCLKTTIKRWNDALPFLETVLLDSGVFSRPYRNFPYVEPRRKSGSESRIALNKDGVFVKEKLIVDVPLSLTDDEVIKLLFDKINADVGIILNWAQQQARNILTRHEGNGGEFDYMDFDLSPVQIKSKYRTTTLREANCGDIAYRLGLPTSYSLDPFIFLLIKEHPQITESFLLNLELYDKHGKLVGLESTDSRKYLVGYKKRRGGRKSLQRIALNESSAEFVGQVIKLTGPLRSYLKSKGDDSNRLLFLSCRTGFCYPAPIRNTLNAGNNTAAATEERIEQLIELGGAKDRLAATELVSRLSPTRFRATVGLQVFLETGSAKAMSEALGHAKYKPELLSHYLPEPILRFFQSRWIRIFQKGIVCEAMKNSALLLRASNFSSIDELNSFLNHHALKFPDDAEDQNGQKKYEAKEVCICVDENILTALLSLESAVATADKSQVSAKAQYWSKFASLLQVEIERNTYDTELIHALTVARSKVDPTLMQGMIYEAK